jgi:hypothetical protein
VVNQAAGVERAPFVGLELFADGQALAQHGLGFEPLSLHDEALAQRGDDTRQTRVFGPELLAGGLAPRCAQG